MILYNIAPKLIFDQLKFLMMTLRERPLLRLYKDKMVTCKCTIDLWIIQQSNEFLVDQVLQR